MSYYDPSACITLSKVVACSVFAEIAVTGAAGPAEWFTTEWGKMTLGLMGKSEDDIQRAIKRIQAGQVQGRWAGWLEPVHRMGVQE